MIVLKESRYENGKIVGKLEIPAHVKIFLREDISFWSKNIPNSHYKNIVSFGQNSTLHFKAKGHFLKIPVISLDKTIPFIVHENELKKESVVFLDDLIIFNLNLYKSNNLSIYYSKNNKYYNFGKISTLFEKVLSILINYFSYNNNNNKEDKRMVVLEKALTPQIYCFDDLPEKYEETAKIRKILAHILILLNVNYLENYPILPYFLEYKIFNRMDYILLQIYNDYTHNTNNQFYKGIDHESSMLIEAKPLNIINMVTDCKKIPEQKSTEISSIQPFPSFSVKIEAKIIDIFMIIKIKIEQQQQQQQQQQMNLQNGRGIFRYSGYLPCKIVSDKEIKDILLEIENGEGEHYLHCKGRVTKPTKREFKAPFQYLEINPYGGFPCKLIVEESIEYSYNKLNSKMTGIFTKLVTLDSLIFSGKNVEITKLYPFLDFDEMSYVLIEKTCSAIFNSKHLDEKISGKSIQYKIDYAIRLYKRYHERMEFKYISMKKILLEKIGEYRMNEKILRFLKDYVSVPQSYISKELFLMCKKVLGRYELLNNFQFLNFVLIGNKKYLQ